RRDAGGRVGAGGARGDRRGDRGGAAGGGVCEAAETRDRADVSLPPGAGVTSSDDERGGLGGGDVHGGGAAGGCVAEAPAAGAGRPQTRIHSPVYPRHDINRQRSTHHARLVSSSSK